MEMWRYARAMHVEDDASFPWSAKGMALPRIRIHVPCSLFTSLRSRRTNYPPNWGCFLSLSPFYDNGSRLQFLSLGLKCGERILCSYLMLPPCPSGSGCGVRSWVALPSSLGGIEPALDSPLPPTHRLPPSSPLLPLLRSYLLRQRPRVPPLDRSLARSVGVSFPRGEQIIAQGRSRRSGVGSTTPTTTISRAKWSCSMR